MVSLLTRGVPFVTHTCPGPSSLWVPGRRVGGTGVQSLSSNYFKFYWLFPGLLTQNHPIHFQGREHPPRCLPSPLQISPPPEPFLKDLLLPWRHRGLLCHVPRGQLSTPHSRWGKVLLSFCFLSALLPTSLRNLSSGAPAQKQLLSSDFPVTLGRRGSPHRGQGAVVCSTDVLGPWQG